MKKSTKILGAIFLLGIVYTGFEVFSASDGASAYYDGSAALIISSIALFISSIVVGLIYIRQLKKHLGILFFLAISTPLTLSGFNNLRDNLYANRDPDLTPKYRIPVSRAEYYRDSIQILSKVDSIISEPDELEVLSASIDTIIYSEKGDMIFVSYIKTMKSKWGNYYQPGYLVSNNYALARWQWRDCTYTVTGDYDSEIDLKLDIRKHYFNNFTLLDKDSLADNYFWKAIL